MIFYNSKTDALYLITQTITNDSTYFILIDDGKKVYYHVDEHPIIQEDLPVMKYIGEL